MLESCHERLRMYAARWRVTLDENRVETASSLIAFGSRGNDPVALKIVKRESDEWRVGATTRAFHGRGMVRAFEIDDGAALLERATPGTSLVDIAAVDDDRATSIIAAVIREFSPLEPPPGTRTVEDWGRSFEQYHISGDRQVAPNLVLRARASYDALCTSQTDRRLLHGDLQHSNILMDRDRGWLAIDPKGLIGEPECEVGPFLRNPPHLPHLFNRLETVERRLRILCNEAALRYDRAIGWAFALAVLSAIWGVEDDGVVYDDSPALTLARALLPAIESAPKSG